MQRPRFWLIVPLLLSVTAPAMGEAESSDRGSEAGPDAIAFFENHIRPLLAKRCYACHGRDKQEGNLRLDARDRMLAGGESGPAVVPGKPQESLLMEAVQYASLEMPPQEPLPAGEIALLARWIETGAPWPQGAAAEGTRPHERITDEDRAFWSFQPLWNGDPPDLESAGWVRNEIDRFVLARLHENGLTPAPEAERAELIRRVYFDLIGLPPSPEEVQAFVDDPADDAYERLVDRLLKSPRYGERWARHWLDLVRYAESDGYKQDAYRPQAWRYRDYVIRSLNDDKPYNQFVMEQLAGDEMSPHDTESLAATSYLRHWIYEYNQRDVRTQWETILDDVTNVTGEVFLGLSVGCARCHDHKFDPILREDYFRLRAFFAPLLPRDDIPYVSGNDYLEYRKQHEAWLAETADIRARLAELEKPVQDRVARPALEKFPRDVRPMLYKPAEARTPYEQQLATLAYKQVEGELAKLDMESKLKGEDRERWKELRAQLAEFDAQKPAGHPAAFTVRDVGPVAPATTIPGDTEQRDIAPGFLSVLDPESADIEPAPALPDSTGRRYTLAKWLTDPENPLTTRVIVNRIWHYHFGRGMVSTPSNLGELGGRPSHPRLLDWLARRFTRDGWTFKSLHRLIVTSATYRQSAHTAGSDRARQIDAENGLLWRMNIRRLAAEQIRDAMLATSGELDRTAGGPSVETAQPRRTIYTKVIRNRRDPLLEAFDAPDGFSSVPQRNVTTTATQALYMINSDWTLKRAAAFARRVRSDAADPGAGVERAYRHAWGRAPSPRERERAVQFLTGERLKPGETASSEATTAAWIDFCHVLLNSNEFLYID